MLTFSHVSKRLEAVQALARLQVLESRHGDDSSIYVTRSAAGVGIDPY